ncbi:formyltetrahydrofolate deformylase [Helicobacter sp. 13S00401-1]|uniref:formyltetrahydrofolate deformylase n=1 Tax=Helicobacter sp. 13S00401-1 TaxID=1905758 RepID=UPI000BA6CBF0|nr:formyltetrahydrofolate deformylase [Helicobacter sp. 13S00401-1]PAF49691.1 formyltetrahydrofolate deformylase [Helicobacter sp. 13S00401-1]
MDVILKVSTEDAKGLVAKVSHILYERDLNIEQNSEFVDKSENRFYMRTEFSGGNVLGLLEDLQATLPKNAEISLLESRKKDIVVFCTKENHCLGDLLLKHHSSELNANIKAVISNHENLRELVGKFNVPYFYIPANENLPKEERIKSQEEAIFSLLAKYSFDYIVLAKYMRILSDSFCERFPNKIINIHHSFLPAFIGANPYKQAFERGVKIIGATAHFATPDLDCGPIISQDIINIDHTYTWQMLQRAGKNIERSTLARALDLVFDDRVFIYKNKTVIF